LNPESLNPERLSNRYALCHCAFVAIFYLRISVVSRYFM
jgi:hypothetical protein